MDIFAIFLALVAIGCLVLIVSIDWLYLKCIAEEIEEVAKAIKEATKAIKGLPGWKEPL
jgi:uncharacterized protein YoxC